MPTWTRREALRGIGGAATAALLADNAAAQASSFPRGAVIRTLFKDYEPDELAGGATLFHEHMSLGPDFSDRFRARCRRARARRDVPPPQRPAGPPPLLPAPIRCGTWT